MTRPRLLDLFCCAGGAGMGYHRAGFDVVGVVPQPRYPFMFVQADAVDFLARNWRHFDAIHASPPCQEYTPLHALHPDKRYPTLIEPIRELAESTGLPFVIENVMSAPLRKDRSIRLCADRMGLRTVRHRRFEYGGGLVLTEPTWCGNQHSAKTATSRRRERWAAGWHVSITGDVGTYVGPEAMGIDWMNGDELCEAVPPAYTELIGRALIEHLNTAVESAA